MTNDTLADEIRDAIDHAAGRYVMAEETGGDVADYAAPNYLKAVYALRTALEYVNAAGRIVREER